jgi:hypothetical protein
MIYQSYSQLFLHPVWASSRCYQVGPSTARKCRRVSRSPLSLAYINTPAPARYTGIEVVAWHLSALQLSIHNTCNPDNPDNAWGQASIQHPYWALTKLYCMIYFGSSPCPCLQIYECFLQPKNWHQKGFLTAKTLSFVCSTWSLAAVVSCGHQCGQNTFYPANRELPGLFLLLDITKTRISHWSSRERASLPDTQDSYQLSTSGFSITIPKSSSLYSFI